MAPFTGVKDSFELKNKTCASVCVQVEKKEKKKKKADRDKSLLYLGRGHRQINGNRED